MSGVTDFVDGIFTPNHVAPFPYKHYWNATFTVTMITSTCLNCLKVKLIVERVCERHAAA